MPIPTSWNRSSFSRQIVFRMGGLIALLCLTLTPVLAAAPIFQNPPPNKRPEAVPLPKVPTEYHLRPKELHRYAVDLTGGEFLRIDFEQQGMDLYVLVDDASGKRVVQLNRLESDRGVEPVFFFSETPVQYVVTVGCIYQEDVPGGYQLRPTIHRPPTAEDRHLLRAQEFTMEAEVAGRQAKDKTGFQNSLQKYLEAAQAFHDAGDLASEALMTVFAGRIERTFGNLPKAIEYCTKAVTLLEKQPDPVIQAAALTNIGRSYRLMEQFQTALGYFDQAMVLRKKAGDLVGESIELNNIGSVYIAWGEYRKAEGYLKQSLEISQRVGNISGLASNLGNLATININLGDFEKTLIYTTQSYQLLVKINDQNRQISSLAQIGNIYLRLGKNDEAIEFYQKGLQLATKIGNQQQQVLLLQDLAGVPSTPDATALQYLNQSLEISRSLKSQADEAAALMKLGQFYLEQNQTLEALTYLTRASQLFEVIRNNGQMGGVWRGFGKAFLQQKNYAQAEEQFQKALAQAEQGGNRIASINLINDLAATRIYLGHYDQARADLERAIKMIEQIRATVLDQSFRQSFFSTTQSIFENYIRLLMELHRKDPSAGYDREAFQKNEARRARSLLELLMAPGEGLPNENSNGLLSQEKSLIERILAKEQNLAKSLTESPQSDRIIRIQEEIATLYDDFRQTQAEIRKRNPHYAALTQPRPLSVEQVQQQCLDDNTLLLEYSLGEPKSHLWVISKTGCQVVQLAGKTEIEIKAAALYQNLKINPLKRLFPTLDRPAQATVTEGNGSDKALDQLAREVSRLILGPLKGKIGTKRLLIVADGALHYLPFSALPDPDQSKNVPLLVNHEIVCIPSATTLGLIREEKTRHQSAPGLMALFADPVFELSDPRIKTARGQSPEAEDPKLASQQAQVTPPQSDTPLERANITKVSSDAIGPSQILRLPSTRTEAVNILRLVKEPKQVLARFDFEANREALFSPELGQFRYLHLATHGYFDPTRPERSGLILSLVGPDGKPQDGYVRTADIYKLNLGAELVVLSACETGLGENIQGEGLVGLTRGFMYAGAERVLVSLWSVNDRATAELMTRFYQKILKQRMSPPAALRAAQLEMYRSSKYRLPFYWAAFALQGEY